MPTTIRAGWFQAESEGDSRIRKFLIQPAGWGGGQHEWEGHIREIFESGGEVLALLGKGGIDRHLAYDVLTNSLFDSRVHKAYGGKIVEGRYSPPGMAVPLATKDLRLALAE